MNLSQSLYYPKWVVLQLLENCNLRCSMCYEWGESGFYHKKETLSTLDFDVVKKIINDCLPAKPYFEFFGGEPLLYPQIEEIIKLIITGGCELSFPTNGTLVEKYAELLVELQLTRLWFSLDGPEAINDEQRGKGVFKKAINGLEKLYEIRSKRESKFPKIGITYVVTPANYQYIAEFFFKSIDIFKIDYVSIDLQNYATKEEYQAYADILQKEFGINSAIHAQGYVRDTSSLADMDFASVSQQMTQVKNLCSDQEIIFFAHPKTIKVDNIQNYFSAKWEHLADYKSRCAFPWVYAEISAQGDVTVCHSFYDLSLGNVYEEGILDIWNGEKIKNVRSFLKKQLYPICTACCKYYNNPLSSVDNY